MRTRPATLPWAVRITAVSALLGAETIHAAVIDAHLQEWLPAGFFFALLSITEGLLGVALLARPSRLVVRLAIGVSLAVVALWLVSRTVGVPLGPMSGYVEPLGLVDTFCSLLGLTTAAVLLARPRTRR